MGLVAIVMFIDIILMVTWQLYDPLMIELYDINKEVTFSFSSSLSQLIVGSLRPVVSLIVYCVVTIALILG